VKPDVLAGLTLAALGMPEVLGYARHRPHAGRHRARPVEPISELIRGEGATVSTPDAAPALPADRLAAAEHRLAEAGVGSASRDVEVLAEHVSSLPGEQREQEFTALVERRAERVPLEHLIGRVTFRRIELLVGPGVFVPQPETSPVVQWAVDALQWRDSSGALRAPGASKRSVAPVCVDLCTGSGTIALSLAAEVPGAVVHAVEADPGALEWAARNITHNDVTVRLHAGDAAGALPELDGQVDLVASNPPYVATGELTCVAPEVLDFDPTVALHAGPDGLDVIRAVEATARRLLRPGGLVVVEHSDRQGRSAPAVFAEADDWDDVQDHPDHDGLDRFVTAVRR